MTNLLVAIGIGLAFLLVGGPLAASLAVPLFAPAVVGMLRL